MPIVHGWANPEQTVVRVVYPERWNWTECLKTHIELREIVSRRPEVVYMIVDFSKSPNIPADAMSMINKVLALLPENLGAVVLMNMPPMAWVFRRVIIRLKPELASRFPEATSFEEAMSIVNAQRERIA